MSRTRRWRQDSSLPFPEWEPGFREAPREAGLLLGSLFSGSLSLEELGKGLELAGRVCLGFLTSKSPSKCLFLSTHPLPLFSWS